MTHTVPIECSFADCRQNNVGPCDECKGFYCGKHMHYYGKDPDSGHNITYCVECSGKIENEKAIQPIPMHKLPHKELADLRGAAISYVEDRIHGRSVKDCDHYIFEEVIQLFYGEDIWKELNKLPDRG